MADYFQTAKEHIESLPTWAKVIVGVVATGGAVHLIGFVAKKTIFNQRRPHKKDFKPGVVYLYQFPRARVIPNMSPYALKLETWLRMADVVYENVKTPMWFRSREGTLPFIELNGIEYDDSTFIIRDLTKILKKDSVDITLTPEQKAISRAFEQMTETSTVPSYAYIRVSEHFPAIFDEKINGMKVPFLLKLFFTYQIKKSGLRRLKAQGVGRHPREEIISIGLDDLRSISEYLGTKQYFHGDTPTRVDATLFGTLAQLVYIPLESPHSKFLQTDCRNLIRYCDRIKEKYWPDWNEACKLKDLNTWKK